jgi:hypothetical protein
MEIFIKFGVGIAAALFGAVILYAFRVRQLYLLIPKMFSHCALFDKGKLVEIKVFNRGNNMEEGVEIVMPPGLKCDLLASELPGIELQKSIIKINRLPQKSEASILLLIEGEVDEYNFSPSLTSKLAKGKQFKKQDEIPPNAGSAVLLAGLALAFISFLLYAPNKYFEYQRAEAELERKELLTQEEKQKSLIRAKYSYLDETGWKGIDKYIDSGLSKAYSEFEFPLVASSAKLEGKVFSMNFSAINKTAAVIKVTAYFQSIESSKSLSFSKDSVFDLEVKPMSSKDFVVSMNFENLIDMDKVFLGVSIKYGNDHLWDLQLFPSSNDIANKALQRTSR